jgi:spore coat protein CotH
VPASDGLTTEEITARTATLRKFIEERTEALKDQV